ncbi:MAG: hypothetical protein LAT67_10050 [Balneolales bacterium]|nr:hypothetical protein [Balneolales bacterium]
MRHLFSLFAKSIFPALALLLWLVPETKAQIISSETEKRTVLAYQNDMAIISDLRELVLKQGENHVQIQNLPDIALTGRITLQSDLQLIEARFPVAGQRLPVLAERLENTEVRLVNFRTDENYSGKMRQTEDGRHLLITDEGDIIINQLNAYFIQPITPLKPEEPVNTLNIVLYAPEAGTFPIRVLYSSTSLRWTATHNLIAQKDVRNIEWKTTANILNSSEQPFEDIDLVLISGNITMQDLISFDTGDFRDIPLPPAPRESSEHIEMDTFLDMDSGIDFQESQASDLRTYRLDGITIPARSELQLPLLHQEDLGYSLVFQHQIGRAEAEQVTVNEYITTNERAETNSRNTLEFQIPRGPAQLYIIQDDGTMAYSGRFNLPLSNPGQEIMIPVTQYGKLRYSERFSNELINPSLIKRSGSVQFENTGSEDAEITLTLPISSNQRLQESSHSFEIEDNRARASIWVSAHSATEVSITLHQDISRD